AIPNGTMAAKIDATTIITNRMLCAMRMAISGQFASVLSKPRRRTSVVLRKRLPVVGDAGELDLASHLVQTAAQTLADPVGELLHVIRRENCRALRVVAAVDDVVEDVLYEHRWLLRSELVENEQIDVEQRPQDF